MNEPYVLQGCKIYFNGEFFMGLTNKDYAIAICASLNWGYQQGRRDAIAEIEARRDKRDEL